MFTNMWHIAKELKQPIHVSLTCLSEYPYTVNYVIKRRMMIDNWNELPKEKRPPRCLSLDTIIYIRRNNEVELIRIGDLLSIGFNNIEIMSPTGWKKIINVVKRKENKVIIRFAYLEDIICSEDHRFLCGNKKVKPDRFIMAKDMIKDYYHNYVAYKPLDEFLDVDEDNYESVKLNYESGFLVGSFAAEGGIAFNTLKFTINEDEKDFANKLSNIFRNLGLINTDGRIKEGLYKVYKNPSDTQKVLRLKASDRRLVKFINTFVMGTCKNKALIINKVLNSPKEFRLGVFEGMLTGDGYCKEGFIRFTYTSASKQLRDDFGIVASSVGVLTSKGGYKGFDKRYNKYFENFTCSSRVGRGGVTRKIGGYYQLPMTKKIITNELVDMIDIEVEDNLFIINEGIVSHNSIWDKPSEVEEWFERVFESKTQTEFDLNLRDIETEE